MKVETDGWVAARIGQLDHYASASLVRRVPGATLEMEPELEPGVLPVEPVAVIVPRPRRASVFLRHGEGHGRFAELTITHPARD